MKQNIIINSPNNWKINDIDYVLVSTSCQKIDDYNIHVHLSKDGGESVKLFDYRESTVNSVLYNDINQFINSLGLSIEPA